MWRSLRPKSNDDGALQKIGALERKNAELIESLAGIQARFRALARAVWRVEEDERRRFARELHDNLGQVLTALRMRLERLPEGEERSAAIGMASQALEDVRNLSRLLRPPVLDDLGLLAALQWLARRMREDAGLPTSVTGSIDIELDDEIETLFFRIAQEALTNVAKHAAATRAEISIQRVADRLELRIRDNGRGFAVEALSADGATGVGLAGMRDRVAFLGGDLAISSAPGIGTTICATLALPKREAGA